MSSSSSLGTKHVARVVAAEHGELAAMVDAGLLVPIGQAGGRRYELTPKR